jgi:succinate dehydrogenase/fumarate reductase flavoprotein subunit
MRLAMLRTMQRHCAVFRTGSLLEEGSHKLDDVIEMMRADLAVADRSMMFNTDLTEALEQSVSWQGVQAGAPRCGALLTDNGANLN